MEKLIFHGYFGVFVYDLKQEKITLAIDLEKAVGTNQIQGSTYVNVEVDAKGDTMMLYVDGSDEAHQKEQMAYTIDTTNGWYTYDVYKPFEQAYEVSDTKAYRGETIGELCYGTQEKDWKLFEKWQFVEE